MRINDKATEPLRTELLKSVRPVGTEAGQKPQPEAQPAAPRGDRVQISDAARELAAQAEAAAGGEAPVTGLSAERAGEIRQRILEGAYNSLNVVDEVARRILKSGDL